MRNITPKMSASGKSSTVLKALVAAVIIAAAAAGGYFAGQSRPSAVIEMNSGSSIQGDAASGTNDLADMQAALRSSADAILPAVVSLQVVDIIERPTNTLRSPFDLFFGDRNNNGATEEQRQEGLGSGVIIGRDGASVFVLSNNHVVGEADEIRIALYDGREFSGTLVGQDEGRDIAVVTFLTDEDVPMAELGDSASLRVGDMVMAVGSPLGYSSSVTQGIVSALGREAAASSQIAGFTDYIQTDAAINPGNSGGALVNIYGQLVGINTWIASSSGGSVGIGFAVPVNNIRLDEIISSGSVSYGWLGVLSSDDEQGSAVSSIITGSPAADAGILPGDIIQTVGGKAIASASELTTAIGRVAPGEDVEIAVIRGGSRQTLTATLGTRPSDAAMENLAAAIWPGFSVTTISDSIRQRLKQQDSEGNLMITAVTSGSIAETAGLSRGDIILEVNNRQVDDRDQLYAALNGASGDEVIFTLLRNGREIKLGLTK